MPFPSIHLFPIIVRGLYFLSISDWLWNPTEQCFSKQQQCLLTKQQKYMYKTAHDNGRTGNR